MDKLPVPARSMSDLPTLKELEEFGMSGGLIRPGEGVTGLIARIQKAVAASDRATDFRGRTSEEWYHDTYRVGLGEGIYDYANQRTGPETWKDRLMAILAVVDYRVYKKGKNPRYTGTIDKVNYLNPREFLRAATDELSGLTRYTDKVLSLPTPGQHVNGLNLSYLAEYLKSRGKIIALEGNLMSAVDDPNFTGRGPFLPSKTRVFFDDNGRIIKVIHPDSVVEGGDFVDLYLFDADGKCISYETRKNDEKYRLITEEGYYWPDENRVYVRSEETKSERRMPYRQGLLAGLGHD